MERRQVEINMEGGSTTKSKLKCLLGNEPQTAFGVHVYRYRRLMDVVPTCNICGMEPESSHNAMVKCTKGVLPHCLRELWKSPTEKKFMCAGTDWVLVLLQMQQRMRSKLLSSSGDIGTCGIIQFLAMVSVALNNSIFLQPYLRYFQ
jgi:hypothetical protein